MIPIADIDLIARSTGGKWVASKHFRSIPALGACLLDRADDVATDLFVALQL